MSEKSNKLNLSRSEIRDIKIVIRKFGNSNLKTEQLFDLFIDWQSSKTRSLKRFVLTFTFLLTMALILGVDITKIEPFGINVADVNKTYFLHSLLVVHIFTFIYFRVQRSVDLNVKKARISFFEMDLNEFIKLTDIVDEIIEASKAPNLSYLITEVTGTSVLRRRDEKVNSVYKAISFFKDKLRKEHTKNELGEAIETVGFYIFFIAGIASIIFSHYSA